MEIKANIMKLKAQQGAPFRNSFNRLLSKLALLKKINDFCAGLKTAFEDNVRAHGRKSCF